jgi:hypothetical protein
MRRVPQQRGNTTKSYLNPESKMSEFFNHQKPDLFYSVVHMQWGGISCLSLVWCSLSLLEARTGLCLKRPYEAHCELTRTNISTTPVTLLRAVQWSNQSVFAPETKRNGSWRSYRILPVQSVAVLRLQYATYLSVTDMDSLFTFANWSQYLWRSYPRRDV